MGIQVYLNKGPSLSQSRENDDTLNLSFYIFITFCQNLEFKFLHFNKILNPISWYNDGFVQACLLVRVSDEQCGPWASPCFPCAVVFLDEYSNVTLNV